MRLALYFAALAALLLSKFDLAAQAAAPFAATGSWAGKLDVGGQMLPLVFHVTESAGQLSATLDSPDQGAFGLPVSEVSYSAPTLHLKATKIGFSYEGAHTSSADTLLGHFEQGGHRMPLTLVRTAAATSASEEASAKTAPKARPQEPSAIDYQSADFSIPAGDHTLGATLTRPSKGKIKAAVILVSGSGPQNRDEELLGHRPFLVLADRLTKAGIAVLRYDDRGVGASTGSFAGSTSADFADDAVAALRFLRVEASLKGLPIGIVGHSEGGMIAPMVAASQPALVDFLVLLAAPGIAIDSLLPLQIAGVSSAEGMPAQETAAAVASTKAYFTILKSHQNASTDQLTAALRQQATQEMEALPDAERSTISDTNQYINGQIGTYLDPWFRYFATFDPADYLLKTKVPVLALNGSLDLQVTATENLGAIQRVLAKAGNKQVTVRELAGLNHLFQPTKTGRPSEYANIETTFDEATMREIGKWIVQRQVAKR